MDNITLAEVVRFLAILAGIALVLALIMLVWVFWRIKHINLPPNADFFTALRHTPFSVVLLIDLLDMSLDFLAAPFAWIILGKLGLAPLRGVSVIESFIPGTQVLPTMTIAWVIARVVRGTPRLPGM